MKKENRNLDGKGAGLSEAQIRYFHTFGYLVLKQLFSVEELLAIDREYKAAMAEQYPHKPFDGASRHWTAMMEENTPFFASLLEDPRFLTVAKQLYGEDVLGILADANRYVGDTHWHRDTSRVLQDGVKFAFYLDSVGPESGALRVIPGTHRLPDDAAFAGGVKALRIGEVPAHALSSEPGDVVAFDLRLWHGSHGGSDDRRMCTVVYYANPRTSEEEEFLRDLGGKIPLGSYKAYGCKRQFIYSADWLAERETSRDREWWVSRLREIGFLAAPGLAEEGWEERYR